MRFDRQNHVTPVLALLAMIAPPGNAQTFDVAAELRRANLRVVERAWGPYVRIQGMTLRVSIDPGEQTKEATVRVTGLLAASRRVPPRPDGLLEGWAADGLSVRRQLDGTVLVRTSFAWPIEDGVPELRARLEGSVTAIRGVLDRALVPIESEWTATDLDSPNFPRLFRPLDRDERLERLDIEDWTLIALEVGEPSTGQGGGMSGVPKAPIRLVGRDFLILPGPGIEGGGDRLGWTTLSLCFPHPGEDGLGRLQAEADAVGIRAHVWPGRKGISLQVGFEVVRGATLQSAIDRLLNEAKRLDRVALAAGH